MYMIGQLVGSTQDSTIYIVNDRRTLPNAGVIYQVDTLDRGEALGTPEWVHDYRLRPLNFAGHVCEVRLEDLR